MKLRFILLCAVSGLPLLAETLWEKYPVSFTEAMSCSKSFDEQCVVRDEHWQVFEVLYTRAMQQEFSPEPRIPPVFHLVWLGSEPPHSYRALKANLEKMHPGWKVRLWTDADAAKFPLKNRKAFERARNYGEKSDILRYEILYRFGGVYLDGDFEIVQPFTDLNRMADFYTGIAYDKSAQLFNGLIGTVPRHPIIKWCIDDLGTDGSKRDVNAIMNRTGPYHFTRCFFKGCADVNAGVVVAFPTAFFYAWPLHDRFAQGEVRKRNIQGALRPYSYAVHLWHASWTKRPRKKK